MSKLTLYWALGSQPGRAVKTVIDMGKVPHDLVTVDVMQRQQRSKQYLNIYPVGKIPLLKDGQFILGESGAIMTYLCEKYPTLSYLSGESIEQRAVINQYVSWYQSYFRPALFKPIRMFLGAVFSGVAVKKSHKEDLFKDMFQAIATFNQILRSNGNKFIAGDRVSIADLLLFYELTNLKYFGLNHDEYKDVKRWFEEVHNVPEVKRITQEWSQVANGLKEVFAGVEISPKL